MAYTVAQIAEALQASAEGDLSLTIERAAEPGDAGAQDLALAMAPKYAEDLAKGQARAAILWEGADWHALGLEAAILVARPRMALSGLTRLMDPGQGQAAGIHPSAVIDPSAILGDEVSIGPLAVIGAGAEIGAGSVIGPQCYIGTEARIGPDALLRDHVSVGAYVQIGARFIAQPGARIGNDGFSFVTPEVSATERARETMGDQSGTAAQSYVRIHSLGGVVIGDDVEIGANCTIDSGTIRATEIGNGTKLDNLVHVGHNTRIGTDCLLCGQAGISGSVDIGNHSVLGGQVGVVDNIFIGERVIVAGGTKVLSNVPAGRVMMGYPAVKMDLHTEIYKAQRRLPRLMNDVAALKKAVFNSGGSD